MNNKRVIVIDDSELVLAVASDALENAGYEVIATDSGIDANRYIYASPQPALILIDVMMPMLNGDRKVRLLKQRQSSSRIPILLMSTKPAAELEELVKSSGADGYIPKPFDENALVRRVGEHIAA